MRFKTGKHAGKLSEIVFLKEPDFAAWMMETHPDSATAKEFARLKVKFDARPLLGECDSHDCQKPAKKASAYNNTSSLMFWCADCNPYNSGAREGTLRTVRTFEDAIRHIDYTCDSGHRSEKRAIIKALAAEKGAPKRLTEGAAIAFFQ